MSEILYKVAGFVSLIVHNFVLFVPVRALKGAAFSACEPEPQPDPSTKTVIPSPGSASDVVVASACIAT